MPATRVIIDAGGIGISSARKVDVREDAVRVQESVVSVTVHDNPTQVVDAFRLGELKAWDIDGCHDAVCVQKSMHTDAVVKIADDLTAVVNAGRPAISIAGRSRRVMPWVSSAKSTRSMAAILKKCSDNLAGVVDPGRHGVNRFQARGDVDGSKPAACI